MYSVSNDYLAAIHSAVQSGHISGIINNTIQFGADDVLLGSATISNQCADSSDVKLGSVYVGTLKITFCKTSLLPRGAWEGAKIQVFWNQLISQEPDTYEQIPCGEFYVSEANHAAEGVVITAYDNMAKFDKVIGFTTTSGSPYNILKMCCSQCGVNLGLTKADVEALPNGTETVGLFPENDCSTFRDIVSCMAQALGCFATINRNGELILKAFGDTSVISFAAYERISGGTFSDFKSFYTSVSVVNLNEQTVEVSKVLPDNGLQMNLGSNPFLQYGFQETRVRMREAILGALSDFKYTPFSVTLLGNPCFDLGDVITFTGGLAGTSQKCCVMAYVYSFNRSFQVKGFGQNPKLLGAQGKTDKDITGISKQNQSNETKFEVYTNADQIEQETSNTKNNLLHLASLTFACSKDTVVEVNTSVNAQWYIRNQNAQSGDWETLKNQFLYVLDNSTTNPTIANCFDYAAYQEVYQHDENIPLAGAQRYDFYMPILNVKGGDLHTLDLYWREIRGYYGLLQYINKEGLRITLRGQGIVVEKPWDGFIIVDDTTTPVSIGGMDNEELDDTTTVTVIVPLPVNLSDSVELHEMAGLQLDDVVDNAPQIMLARPKRNIITIRSGNLINIDETKNFTTI